MSTRPFSLWVQDHCQVKQQTQNQEEKSTATATHFSLRAAHQVSAPAAEPAGAFAPTDRREKGWMKEQGEIKQLELRNAAVGGKRKRE